MLWALDDNVFETIADAFKLRLLNHVSENDENGWDTNIVQCIQKKLAPTHPSRLRPITVLPVLLKLYLAVVVDLESKCMDKISELQFAFRPNRMR